MKRMAKAVAAFVTSGAAWVVANVAQTETGIHITFNGSAMDYVEMFFAAVVPILVYAVPNQEPENPTPGNPV